MNVGSASRPGLADLYRERILDHSRSPRHFGPLPGATHHASGINPLCGDKLAIRLRIRNDARIVAGAFEGSGCAISIASASMMTETVIDRMTDDAEAIANTMIAGLKDGFPAAPGGVAEELRALAGVRDYPSRVKCATLPWHALLAALSGQATPVCTE